MAYDPKNPINPRPKPPIGGKSKPIGGAKPVLRKAGNAGINRRKEEDLNRKTPLNANEQREAGKRGYKLANEIGGIGGYLAKGLMNGKGATRTATEDATNEMKREKRKKALSKAMSTQYDNSAYKAKNDKR
jgi:hypothetical protein